MTRSALGAVGACLGIAIAALSAGPQGPEREQSSQTIFERTIDGHDLRVTKSWLAPSGRIVVRIALRNRSNSAPWREIGRVEDPTAYSYSVERVDPSAIVLCRTASYAFEAGCTKLFVDLERGRVRAQFDFAWPDVALADGPARIAALKLPAASVELLQQHTVFDLTYGATTEPPPQFATRPLPQSTYRDFARIRPRRVREGYRAGDTQIKEQVGPWQPGEGGVWFAKSFYDGEGLSGVGDLGVLSSAGRYSFLRIPEMADYSALGFLVEPSTVWAGRVIIGEGAHVGRGLLQYRRVSRTAVVHEVPGVIHNIVRVDDVIALGTTHGLCLIRNGIVTRYRMEPDITGKSTLVAARIGQ